MNEPNCEITGPGIARAIREAKAAKKNIEFAYDFDNNGRIIRIGYILIDKDIRNRIKPTIIWFNENEICIKYLKNHSNECQEAYLDATYTHKRENERHFLLYIPIKNKRLIVIRNLFRIKNNKVSDFLIQIEEQITINSQVISNPIIRYDCAHGFIHRDMISSKGVKEKHDLGTADTKEAIVIAFNELKKNLNTWFISLGYKALPSHTLNQKKLREELEKSKTILIDLIENPNKITNVKSHFVHMKDGPDSIMKIWPPPFFG
ncbi:hypothetical protein ACFL1R_01820 [Candidatus Latescibacterota bacterium]